MTNERPDFIEVHEWENILRDKRCAIHQQIDKLYRHRCQFQRTEQEIKDYERALANLKKNLAHCEANETYALRILQAILQIEEPKVD